MRKTLEMILGSSAGNVTTVAKMTRPRLFAESVNRFRVYTFSLPTSYPRSARLCLVEVEPVMSYQTIRRISSAVTTVTGKVRVRQMRNTQDRQREGEKQREREGKRSTCEHTGRWSSSRSSVTVRRVSMLHAVTPRTEWGDRRGPGSEAVARGGGEEPRGW